MVLRAAKQKVIVCCLIFEVVIVVKYLKLQVFQKLISRIECIFLDLICASSSTDHWTLLKENVRYYIFDFK